MALRPHRDIHYISRGTVKPLASRHWWWWWEEDEWLKILMRWAQPVHWIWWTGDDSGGVGSQWLCTEMTADHHLHLLLWWIFIRNGLSFFTPGSVRDGCACVCVSALRVYCMMLIWLYRKCSLSHINTLPSWWCEFQSDYSHFKCLFEQQNTVRGWRLGSDLITSPQICLQRDI